MLLLLSKSSKEAKLMLMTRQKSKNWNQNKEEFHYVFLSKSPNVLLEIRSKKWCRCKWSPAFGHLSSILKLTLIDEIVAFFDTAARQPSMQALADGWTSINLSPLTLALISSTQRNKIRREERWKNLTKLTFLDGLINLCGCAGRDQKAGNSHI